MKTSIRDVDTVAHMGGDEFAILLEAASTPEDVKTIVQQIQMRLGMPYEWRGNSIVGGASISAVMNIAPYEQMDASLQDADTAMYRAKASGHDQFVVFEIGMGQKTKIIIANVQYQ